MGNRFSATPHPAWGTTLTHAQALQTFPRIAAFIQPLKDTPKFYNAVVQALADYPEDFGEKVAGEDFGNPDPAAHDDPEEFALSYFDSCAEQYCKGLEHKNIFYAMFIKMCHNQFGNTGKMNMEM